MASRTRKNPLAHGEGWKVEDLFTPSQSAGLEVPSPTLRFSRNVHATDAPDPVPGVKAPLPLHIFMSGGGALHLALHPKRGVFDLRVWDSDCDVFGSCSQEGLRGFLIRGLPRPLLLPVIEADWDMGKTLLLCKNADSALEVSLQSADPGWSIQWPRTWHKAPAKMLLKTLSEDLVHAAAAWGGNRLMIASWNDHGTYFYRPTGHGRPMEMEWKRISSIGLSRLGGLRVQSEGVTSDGLFWKGDGWALRVPFEPQRLTICPLEDCTWPSRDGVSLLPGASQVHLPLPDGSLRDARACLTGKGDTLSMEIVVDGVVRLSATRRLAMNLPISFSRWVSYRMLYPLWGHFPLTLLVTPATLLFYHDSEAMVLRAPPV
jgi:hypothetical protein